MSSHYFIGIKAPSSLWSHVEVYRDKLSLEQFYKVIPHKEDLHMTLLFIGSFPDERLRLLQEILTSVAGRHSSIHLHVNHLSYFGSPKGPRVVYLGMDDSQALIALQRDINDSCKELLGLSDSKKFTPHITIAKKRKFEGGESIVKELFEGVPFQVDGFSLFKIHPSRNPKYEQITYFSLL